MKKQLIGSLLFFLSACPQSGEPEPMPTPTLGDGECYEDSDCSNPTVCYDRTQGCFRPENCKDSDPGTRCDTSCVGVCVDPFTPNVYCESQEECTTGLCRNDRRFCVEDRRFDDHSCVGWCTGTCFTAATIIVDPETGACYHFGDSCTPPGFVVDLSRSPCIEQ